MTRIEAWNDTATCSAGGLRERVLAELLVEVFVFQYAEDQRLVVLEQGDQMAGIIQRVNCLQIHLPTPAIGSALPRSCRR